MIDFKRRVEEAAEFIKRHLDGVPEIGLILGTGLGGVVDGMGKSVSLEYEDIPHYPVSTVESHHGRLVYGSWHGKRIIAMQGRFHLYEGYSPLEISFPIRVLRAIGVKTLIISNAAGGLNPNYEAGDLMLVNDHINLTGRNPLVGPNCDEWGLRFPDMTEAYNLRLRKVAERTALSEGIRLRAGVYIGVIGPCLETPAETRFLRMAGADAVGMSLIMEAITAVHSGMEVLAFSVITNVNLPDCCKATTIEEVIATANRAGERFALLLGKIVAEL